MITLATGRMRDDQDHMTPPSDRSIGCGSGGARAVPDHRRLGFLDPEIEVGFQAAERDRNLDQARFVLTLAMLVDPAFAVRGGIEWRA